MNNSLKVGIDFHGVIDTFPKKFKQLAYALVKDGAEVHVVTGQQKDGTMEKALQRAGIRFTHYFSIVDHLIEKGVPIKWVDGQPFADKALWDSAKAEYCKSQGIDFMIDDSSAYRETFHQIDTTYLHLVNRPVKDTARLETLNDQSRFRSVIGARGWQ
jgi:hypothetical protein